MGASSAFKIDRLLWDSKEKELFLGWKSVQVKKKYI